MTLFHLQLVIGAIAVLALLLAGLHLLRLGRDRARHWPKLKQWGASLLGAAMDDPLTLDLPVSSPCAGEIIWARNDVSDVPDFKGATPAGNVVGIACQGVLVYLGHLRKGSVTVTVGDQVDVGATLGRLGMSGRTFGPHLHMHAERGEHQGDVSDNPGVAMLFSGEFLWTNRLFAFD